MSAPAESRSDRQQRMAAELATWIPTAEEHEFIEAMTHDMAEYLALDGPIR
jgi:hypothetical protein